MYIPASLPPGLNLDELEPTLGLPSGKKYGALPNSQTPTAEVDDPKENSTSPPHLTPIVPAFIPPPPEPPLFYSTLALKTYCSYGMRVLQPFSAWGLNAVLIPGAGSRVCRMCGDVGHYEIECPKAIGGDLSAKRMRVQLAGVLAREARRNLPTYNGTSQRAEGEYWCEQSETAESHFRRFCSRQKEDSGGGGEGEFKWEENPDKQVVNEENDDDTPCAICNLFMPTSNQPVLTCDGCEFDFHSSCLGMSRREVASLPDKWYCPSCLDDDNVGEENIVEIMDGYAFDQNKRGGRHDKTIFAYHHLFVSTARGGGEKVAMEVEGGGVTRRGGGSRPSFKGSSRHIDMDEYIDDDDNEYDSRSKAPKALPLPQSVDFPKPLFATPAILCRECDAWFPSPPNTAIWGVHSYAYTCAKCNGGVEGEMRWRYDTLLAARFAHRPPRSLCSPPFSQEKSSPPKQTSGGLTWRGLPCAT